MANIYFAKININSKIYDVYKNPETATLILKELFAALDQDKRLRPNNDNSVWIKFINLEKDYDNFTVAGRLVKIFDDDIEIYDSKKDNIAPLTTKELAKSVTFYIDMRNEMVAFTTTKLLGRKQFIDFFKELINSYSDENKFEVFIITNKDTLKLQLKNFKKVSKAEVTLVPPNSNEDEFIALFPKTGDEIKDTGATKIEQTFSASTKDGGINLGSVLFNRIIKAVTNGFGVLKVTGKNKENEKYSISSANEAPQVRFVPANQKASIAAIKERGRAGMVYILAQKEAERHNQKGDGDGTID